MNRSLLDNRSAGTMVRWHQWQLLLMVAISHVLADVVRL